MPWFRVDDTLHGHPKARRAGLAAMGLWNLAGSHSMAYKTEGFVPEWFVLSWPQGKRLAAQLVKQGLWLADAERDEEAGWQFHDWEDYQASADEVEEDREKARDRQRKRRARLRAIRNGDDPDALDLNSYRRDRHA